LKTKVNEKEKPAKTNAKKDFCQTIDFNFAKPDFALAFALGFQRST
jgi:hypothetical protein